MMYGVTMVGNNEAGISAEMNAKFQMKVKEIAVKT